MSSRRGKSGGKEALPPGNPDEKPNEGENQQDAERLTHQPWRIYDQLLKGRTAEEVADDMRLTLEDVERDIQAMREILKNIHPGTTDDDVDRIRVEDLIVRAGFTDGTAQGIKLIAEANARRRSIIDAAKRRQQEAEKRQNVIS